MLCQPRQTQRASSSAGPAATTPRCVGLGIATYDVYVSDNSGPFTLWFDDVPATQTSATINGAVGHSYAFYTIATDNVGHVEAAPWRPMA